MSADFYKNAIVTDGVSTLRIIEADFMKLRAAVIEMGDTGALPLIMELSALSDFKQKELPEGRKVRRFTAAQIAVCDRAWAAIAPIVKGVNVYRLCDPSFRAQVVREAVADSGLSDRSIYKHLRRYFQRGQDRLALIGDFDRCGQRDIPGTAHRGRKSKHYDSYQLGPEDEANMFAIIKKYYKKDERRSIANAWDTLINKHYSCTDGNDETFEKSQGQRPSKRQFQYFLATSYEVGEVLRARVGEKEYGRNHRAKLSSAVKHCLGVGHQYDIDATIIDLYAVFEVDGDRIIGKPTLYLIVDRKSRLIVGFYLGLERASYMAEVEAIVSIAEDKQALCEELGVPYDPNDWPADGIFPTEFIADRAEMLSEAARAVSNRLSINVGLTEALRPDRKPFAENGLKLISTSLQADVPGFDPEQNAKKRRKKGYEQDACLTVRQIRALVLRAIMKINRRPMQKTARSGVQKLAGLEPSPLALWNDGIPRHLGQLSRYTADEARKRLWPIAEASLDAHGLNFRSCTYICADSRFRAWAAEARRSGRQKVEILYTRACVDRIYMRAPGRENEWLEATLSDLTPSDYRGLSFAEVEVIEEVARRDWKVVHEQTRIRTQLQASRDYESIVAEPRKKHAARGPISRKFRRADTAADRLTELRHERERTGRLTDAERAMSEPGKPVLYPLHSETDAAGGNAAESHAVEPPASPVTEAVRSLYSEVLLNR
jgi:hypothetical protein